MKFFIKKEKRRSCSRNFDEISFGYPHGFSAVKKRQNMDPFIYEHTLHLRFKFIC